MSDIPEQGQPAEPTVVDDALGTLEGAEPVDAPAAAEAVAALLQQELDEG